MVTDHIRLGRPVVRLARLVRKVQGNEWTQGRREVCGGVSRDDYVEVYLGHSCCDPPELVLDGGRERCQEGLVEK